MYYQAKQIMPQNNSSSNDELSTWLGRVIFSLGLSSMALLIVLSAFPFPLHALLATPLLTSQPSILSAFLPCSTDPSSTRPNPPLTTSPHPTPPPLCKATHVAPLKESPMQF